MHINPDFRKNYFVFLIYKPQATSVMRPTIPIILCLFFVTGCNFLPQKQPAKKIEIAPEIAGSWELLSLKGIDPSGRIHYPYDKNVEGFAVFDKQNNFTIQYYDASRTRMSNYDPYYCSDAEIRIAFLSGASFFGNYTLKGDSVTLKIKASENPNFNYTKERRYVEILSDTLLLISPGRKLNGIYMQEHSVWKRTGR